MRIFLNRPFQRFVRKESISDRDLCAAIERAESGLIDAELGGGLIKQRIPRMGQGRSGGYRSIVVFCSGDRSFFVYGFAKNQRENISSVELADLRELAKVLLELTEHEVDLARDAGVWKEIKCNE